MNFHEFFNVGEAAQKKRQTDEWEKERVCVCVCVRGTDWERVRKHASGIAYSRWLGHSLKCLTEGSYRWSDDILQYSAGLGLIAGQQARRSMSYALACVEWLIKEVWIRGGAASCWLAWSSFIRSPRLEVWSSGSSGTPEVSFCLAKKVVAHAPTKTNTNARFNTARCLSQPWDYILINYRGEFFYYSTTKQGHWNTGTNL